VSLSTNGVQNLSLMRFASAQLLKAGFEYAACGKTAVKAIMTTRPRSIHLNDSRNNGSSR
jgi:hypothetical protein